MRNRELDEVQIPSPHNRKSEIENDRWFNKLQLAGLAILAKGGQIKQSSSGFLVHSQCSEKWYEVVWDGRRWSCECKFNAKTRRTCKHIYAILFAHKLNLDLAVAELAVECPSCGASGGYVVRHGLYRNKSGLVQRLLCKSCGCRFTDQTCFEKMKYNGRIIMVAMDLYFKGLSYRKISAHLKEMYGVNVTYVAVFNWVRKYLGAIRRYTSSVVPKVGRKWHCDEMQYNVGGNHEYVWNLMDAKTRFLVACNLTRRRRKAEAKRILAKGMKVARRNTGVIVTDGLSSYATAVKELRLEGVPAQHITRAGQNNRGERLNQTLRERSKTMRLNSKRTLAKFTADYQVYYNFLRPHSGLKGRTPAQAAKIAVGHGWFSTLRHAVDRKASNRSQEVQWAREIRHKRSGRPHFGHMCEQHRVSSPDRGKSSHVRRIDSKSMSSSPAPARNLDI